MAIAVNKLCRAWKWRSLVSFYLLFGGIVLLVSGVVLFIAPVGRVAHSTDWRLLGLEKGQWEAVHAISGYVSILFAVVHLVLNWKMLLNYLWNRACHAYRLRAELAAAVFLTVLVVVGSASNWPLFSQVMGLGETLKNEWDTGIVLPSSAEEHEVVIPDTSGEHEEGEDGSSAGWGRFTVEELCAQEGVAVETGLVHLAEYSIEANASSRIRTLADTNGYAPSDIVDILLGLEPGTTEAAE